MAQDPILPVVANHVREYVVGGKDRSDSPVSCLSRYDCKHIIRGNRRKLGDKGRRSNEITPWIRAIMFTNIRMPGMNADDAKHSLCGIALLDCAPERGQD